MTQKEYMNRLKTAFEVYLVDNAEILNAYRYNDHRACDCIKDFKTYVENLGLKFSNCYHSSGIGNNNDYMIFLETIDKDGFVIQKNIANFYYCYGIFGGVYAMLKDLATNEIIKIGRAR